MKNKVTCLVNCYNEAARLPAFFRHAKQWADEILILDKSSPDGTKELAESLGGRVITQPFSPAGFERLADYIPLARNEWIFQLTPGEVPTRELVERVDEAITEHGDKVDIICVPKLLYSFGIFDPDSPWSWSSQPFVIHRDRAMISADVHANYKLRPGRQAIQVSPSATCHILHPTHATVASFLSSHFDYLKAEAARTDLTPEQLMEHGIKNLNAFDFGNHKKELFGIECAWKFYWLGVILTAWEKLQRRDVPAEYSALRERYLQREWPE